MVPGGAIGRTTAGAAHGLRHAPLTAAVGFAAWRKAAAAICAQTGVAVTKVRLDGSARILAAAIGRGVETLLGFGVAETSRRAGRQGHTAARRRAVEQPDEARMRFKVVRANAGVIGVVFSPGLPRSPEAPIETGRTAA